MPLGPESFLYPFQVKADKATESIDGNLAFAVGPSDRLRADFENGGQLIDGQPCLFHHVSFTLRRTMYGGTIRIGVRW
jgi:hypothetical protein